MIPFLHPCPAEPYLVGSGRAMHVVVPHVNLAPETRQALSDVNPEYVDVSADETAYWRLMVHLWEAGETFIIVEHDIVVPPGALAAMWECPRDWCAHPYRMGSIVATALGCVKFGAGLLQRQPKAVSRILPEHRGWNALDSMIIGTLLRNGDSEHVHQPPVRHLHWE